MTALRKYSVLLTEFGGKGQPSENIGSFIIDACMGGHGFRNDVNEKVY